MASFNTRSGWVFGLAILLTCAGSRAEEAESPVEPHEKHKTGKFQVAAQGIPARLWAQTAVDYGSVVSPEMTSAIRSGKVQWITDDDRPYTYEVAVPLSYQPGTPHGVLVYVSPTDRGEPPRQFNQLLGKHRLIAIGANGSGNQQPVLTRHGLAVHAVDVIAQTHDIDSQRIYITGVSGGGRLASHVMLMNCDLFSGGVPLAGTNSYATMPSPSGGTYSGFWTNPDAKRLARAASQSRFVFMTGEKDYNRQDTKLVFESYQKKGFRNVLYLEEPGLGHAAPSAEWFQQAIEFLDAPLKARAAQRYEDAQSAEKRKQLGKALDEYTAAALHGGEGEFVPDALSKAEALRQSYQDAIRQIEEHIAQGDLVVAQKQINQLRTPWGDRSTADMKSLTEKVRQARAESNQKTK